jgi:(p)ppGpp synthase/HD superfamily hydrolase
MNEIVEKVRQFAAKAHEGQTRKYNSEPYTAHLVRVMEMCKDYDSSVPVLSAALLHDVLEDTNIGKERLRQFLSSIMNEEEAGRTFQLIVELTDVYTKSKYPRWNREKRKQKEAQRIEQTSADSQTIKYADIIDNCKKIVQHDKEFGPLFLCECKMLLRRMNRGNSQLYERARKTVEQGLVTARELSEKT